MEVINKLWPVPQRTETLGNVFPAPRSFYLPEPGFGLEGDLKIAENGYRIIFVRDADRRFEEYRLEIKRESTRIMASSTPGFFYGAQTLLQIIRYNVAPEWTETIIEDWPAFRKRCFMADMGRSVFPLPLLKQLVRILGRLKMNQLHLHLYDDELCGIRFDGLPFGQDNPYALTIEELGELLRFAAGYHVEIVPELETWGHVGALTAHRPDLRGGQGIYNGSSFLFKKDVFDLMRNMISQVVKVMPERAVIHLGLDEARWFCSPELPTGFNPEQLVGYYYRMLQEIGHENHKELIMRIWGDHTGRPVPSEISDRVILEPWSYWNSARQQIDFRIGRYASGKSRWMCGVGQSMGQHRGAYHATRYWASRTAAMKINNVEGINITFWGRNDLENHFITLFAGAGFIWNPLPEPAWTRLEEYEDLERILFPMQTLFQHKFREAWPDTLKALRRETIYHGYHYFDDKHGRPFTALVPLAGTAAQHNFLEE